MKSIEIRGARTHNLKNIDLTLPRGKLIVFTGLSGSGKSSLAFDTIYAEGQRRYVESLSAYARQFLSMMEKPDVDHIDGLSPAISIECCIDCSISRHCWPRLSASLDESRMHDGNVPDEHAAFYSRHTGSGDELPEQLRPLRAEYSTCP